MTPDAIHSKVLEILQTVLKGTGISGETLRNETPEWDSLKHLEIVFSVEDAFSVEFSEDEIAEINSPVKIAEAVARKTGKG